MLGTESYVATVLLWFVAMAVWNRVDEKSGIGSSKALQQRQLTRRVRMKDGSGSLTGWSAVPVSLMMAATPMLTALVVSLPIAWLINHIFAANAVHAIFGVEHLGYWRVVGLFAIWFAIQFNIKFKFSFK